MREPLQRAAAAGLLRALDLHFAELVQRLGGDGPTTLAAALVSRAAGEGHVCLELDALAGGELFAEEPAARVTAPAADEWRAALAASPVVGAPGADAPLLLDGGRLYLQRYWWFEQAVAGDLRARAADATDVDTATLGAGIERLFGPIPEKPDRQRLAAGLALLRRLAVISGGPGTGKTWTVTSILALLVLQSPGRLPRIALAAPSGKAAARLSESIRAAKAGLDLPETVRAAVPERAQTLHRLLGIRPGGGSPRHHRRNPLHLDALVVDEASMVDLPLMARLLDALPPAARLILLGDRDQLASVEAGAVLGDICAGAGQWSDVLCTALERAGAGRIDPAATAPAAIADSIALLTESRRFGADSGIGRLAAAVNAADAPGALELLGSASELGHAEPAPEGLGAALAEVAAPAWREYLEAPTPEAALAAFDRFRILCAVRQGPWGVDRVNALVEQALAGAGLIPAGERWYPGRPLMVTRNDYVLGLFNGDVGLVLPDPQAGGALRAFFPTADGCLRRLHPSRLPPHETVYAMTVHKSQGSEFDRVLMLLPQAESPALTRELLYTGITRARTGVLVWGPPAAIAAACNRRVERTSGLRDRLWTDKVG